jgi:hypothetical protein
MSTGLAYTQIAIGQTQISDLFFNYEHTALDGYFASTDEPDQFSDEAKAALLEDAKEFASILNDQVDAAWLVEDYLKRI